MSSPLHPEIESFCKSLDMNKKDMEVLRSLITKNYRQTKSDEEGKTVNNGETTSGVAAREEEEEGDLRSPPPNKAKSADKQDGCNSECSEEPSENEEETDIFLFPDRFLSKVTVDDDDCFAEDNQLSQQINFYNEWHK